MGSNVIVFGWNRALPGREALSGQHFQEFSQYLAAQKGNGMIESFDTVLLEPHGGTLNGFFLIRCEPGKMPELIASADWMKHQIRAGLHLEGLTQLRGVTGAAVDERVAQWMKELPR